MPARFVGLTKSANLEPTSSAFTGMFMLSSTVHYEVLLAQRLSGRIAHLLYIAVLRDYPDMTLANGDPPRQPPLKLPNASASTIKQYTTDSV